MKEGWLCPKCGRVYSPVTPMCLFCGNDKKVNEIKKDTDYWKKVLNGADSKTFANKGNEQMYLFGESRKKGRD